ncbi:MAG: 6-hydroxymethylpterin diphosphokinase MptE-like protein [Rhodospirillaceae bacterium]
MPNTAAVCEAARGDGLRARFLRAGGGRIDRAEVRARAGRAMMRGLPTFRDCRHHGRTWAIVGGGPSIALEVSAIRTLKRKGAHIVSVNKSHDWLLEQGIVPWGHVLLDPKEWVAEYVKRPRKDVRYFIASQCHDATFDALKGFPLFLWHAGQDFEDGAEPACYLREHWAGRPWFVVPGGTTVGLRAIHLGHAMGADRFHLFGLDSSRTGGRMHAYEKTEAPDAASGALALKYAGRKYIFDTNAHMARQQMDFDKFIAEIPQMRARGLLRPGFELTVHGAGLLPFFAAMIGLHADAACNADPPRVGGYIRCVTHAQMQHRAAS